MSKRNNNHDLIEWASKQGWVAERRTRHIAFKHPVAKDIVIVSYTFSDHRGPLNARADLRRALNKALDQQQSNAGTNLQ